MTIWTRIYLQTYIVNKKHDTAMLFISCSCWSQWPFIYVHCDGILLRDRSCPWMYKLLWTRKPPCIVSKRTYWLCCIVNNNIAVTRCLCVHSNQDIAHFSNLIFVGNVGVTRDIVYNKVWWPLVTQIFYYMALKEKKI